MVNVESRAFFIAAGQTLETYNAIIQQRRECNERRNTFRERVGAEGLIVSGSDIVAVTFKDGNAPKGWLKYKRHPSSFYPSRATAAGKALEREMRDTLHFQSFALLGETHIDGSYIHWPTAQKFGDTIIVSQHKDAKKLPPDAIPIKRSEYMAMVEADEAAKQPETAATAGV